MPLTVTHRRNFSDAISDKGLSPNIWGRAPLEHMRLGKMPGSLEQWDAANWLDVDQAGTAGVAVGGQLQMYLGTAAKAIKDTTGAVDRIDMYTGTGGAEISFRGGKIFDTSVKQPIFFETEIEFDGVADGETGWFFGLGDTDDALGTAKILDTNGDSLIATNACLGFWRDYGDGDALDFVYGNGTAIATLKADAVVLTAATRVKVGFILDRQATDASKQLRVFVNNVEQNYYGTKAVVDAATFPQKGLAMIAAGRGDEVAVTSLYRMTALQANNGY